MLSTGDIVQVTLAGTLSGQVLNNVWYLACRDIVGGSVTMLNLLEAWWNHIKASQRNMATTAWTTAFMSLRGEQCDVPAGLYGTFSIPPGEQAGTRSPGSSPGDARLPMFNAVGIRLNVGSKLTRPGQKRLWGLSENDSSNDALGAPVVAALVAFQAAMVGPQVLGAPAALSVVETVVRRSAPIDVPSPNQPVTSMHVQTSIRSQVSRRLATT